jgi:peptidoglycan/xylan/chitin deacetylase (PgdA/CDA1 family)
MNLSATLKNSAKGLWRKSGAFRLLAAHAGAFVLSFHRIRPADNSLINARLGAISPQDLEQYIKLIKDLGFKFVSSEEFREDREGQGKSVCLTFDDGLRDIVDFALPVLRDQQVPATLFLITSTVHRSDLL